jgi:hypothetical protein
MRPHADQESSYLETISVCSRDNSSKGGGCIKVFCGAQESPHPRSVRNLDEIAKFLKSAPSQTS